MKQQTLIFLIILYVLATGCRKEDRIIDDPMMQPVFSVDTIMFDTVFTTIGTITRRFKVYNPYDETLRINEIKVGRSNSNFAINIDGLASNYATNIDIKPNDSLYIFVRATIDPTNKNTPMIITDSIVFNTNGIISDVKLTAWGQDAHYIVPNEKINGRPMYNIVAKPGQNIEWNNDKPYVIYGYAVIDSTATLTIGPGTKIHMHANSGIWVYKGGTIKVMGQKDSVVTFQGDRMDAWFKDKPGQWGRIILNEGNKKNEFNYAVIRNGFIGLQTEILDDPMEENHVILNNTIIENMSAWGIFSRRYRINANNCIIRNCAEVTAYLAQGGYYDFRHCTFSNNWSISVRQTPTVVITNYYEDYASKQIYVSDLENAYFGNCIIYGNTESELAFDKLSNSLFNYEFENCLIKIKTAPVDQTYFKNCIFNQDPAFVDATNGNVHLTAYSPAIGKGRTNISILVKKDIEGTERLTDGSSDIGAIEYITNP